MNSESLKIIQNFVNDTKRILKDNLVEEYLFGSYARKEPDELSDIDILIIVKRFNSKIRRQMSALASDYSLENNVIISPVIKDIQTWEKNKKYRTFFFSEIDRDGLKLC